MPTPRQRATQVSSETRDITAITIVRQRVAGDVETRGVAYGTTNLFPLRPLHPDLRIPPRVAVMEGDLFDVALDWQNFKFPAPVGSTNSCNRAPPIYYEQGYPTNRILVLNTANHKYAGGDWLGGVIGLGAEESLSRRSTLAESLTTYSNLSPGQKFYPLRGIKGVYSPDIVVFRGGPNTDWDVWPERKWKTISMVSVAPVSRPKTDPEVTTYSFIEEEKMQKEKMKTILRIAAVNGHKNLILTPFGSGHKWEDRRRFDEMSVPSASNTSTVVSAGSVYGNPTGFVVKTWYDLLYNDPEFLGYFNDVVFVITAGEGGHHDWFRNMALAEYHRWFTNGPHGPNGPPP